jgi:hypothetical protein
LLERLVILDFRSRAQFRTEKLAQSGLDGESSRNAEPFSQHTPIMSFRIREVLVMDQRLAAGVWGA